LSQARSYSRPGLVCACCVGSWISLGSVRPA
jgi:hypothetical protein